MQNTKGMSTSSVSLTKQQQQSDEQAAATAAQNLQQLRYVLITYPLEQAEMQHLNSKIQARYKQMAQQQAQQEQHTTALKQK